MNNEEKKPSYQISSNEETEFDLFAPPKDDHLEEELAKGSYQWTNKYTKLLAGLVVITSTLSLGAWYGHHSATASTGGTTLRSGLGGFGGGFGAGGFGGGNSGNRSRNSSNGSGATSGGFGGGGFGGPRVTGTIANVSGDKVTITLDDPTQISNLKVGDSTRVTDVTALTGGAPAAVPSGAATAKSSASAGSKSSNGSTNSARPNVGGQGGSGSGQRGGFGGGGAFNNPEFATCLKNEGVTITPGQRPDRSDPKVAAALQKCFSTLGFGNRGGGAPGGAPGAMPSAAPSN